MRFRPNTDNRMNWSLSEYNLICYASLNREIFRSPSGTADFMKERLFEYTAGSLKASYESNLASLAELPTLVVAECNPVGEPKTPAHFSRIDEVREHGDQIRFKFQHLYNQLTSERIFAGYLGLDVQGEHSRQHWAVKEGNLIETIFSFLRNSPAYSSAHFFDDFKNLPRLDHIAVMMPFEKGFDPVRDTIKAACNDLSIEALRVDDICKPTVITSDIFSTIVQSQLVISDLTGSNANVLYETGLAHGNGRDVILLTQQDDIPFNLLQVRRIKYLNNKEGLRELQQSLKKWIRETLPIAKK